MKTERQLQNQKQATEKYRLKNLDKAAAYQREYRKKNREAVRKTEDQNYKQNREERIAYRKKRYRQSKWSYMAAHARRTANNKGLPYDIDASYIKSIWPTDNKCPVFKTTFTVDASNRDSSASLDKLVPSRGYVKGNVRVISFRANRIKSDSTPAELELLLEYCRSEITS